MRPETHLLRTAVLAAAVYLNEAEFVETKAEAGMRRALLARIVALDDETKHDFETNVGMPRSGIVNRLWDKVGAEAVAMLRRTGKEDGLKLADAIDAARGVNLG